MIIDQFRYIKIQPQTIDLSTTLWGINTEFVGFIPQSLVLRSIVWDWILIVYRNCMVYLHLGKQYWCWKQCFPLAKLGDIGGNAYAMKTMNVSGKMVPRFVDVLSNWPAGVQSHAGSRVMLPETFCLYLWPSWKGNSSPWVTVLSQDS